MADQQLLQMVRRWMIPFGAYWLFLLLALSQVSPSSAVQCYICSWSPFDNRTEEWCTEGNFNAHMANTGDCSDGCKYVESYDNNNKIELIHRNCKHLNETIEEGCHEMKTSSYHRRECACSTDLCNRATSAFAASGAILALLLLMIFQLGQP